MSMPSKRTRKGADSSAQPDLHIPFAVFSAVGVLLLALLAVLALLQVKRLAVYAFCFLGVYLLTAGLIFSAYAAMMAHAKNDARSTELLKADVYRLFRSVIHLPYAVINAGGSVRVINGAMQEILGAASPVCNLPLSDLCSHVTMEQLKICVRNPEDSARSMSAPLPTADSAIDPAGFEAEPVVRLADGKRYRVETYLLREGVECYYFLLFRDVNEYLDFMDETNRSHVVLAYIMLDNLRELTQFVRANYRTTANVIEEKLTRWVNGMHGMIREYDRDKYLAIFSEESLDECIRNNFSILDEIMRIPVGDNSFPLSISMGIADIDGTMEDRDKAANAALDMALQRGGNQVALQRRGVNGLKYYGGGHKTLEGNTSISSRVAVHLLERQLTACNSVMIMGHKDPDFDAIGAAVGARRLCRSILDANGQTDVPVRIVTDKDCDTFHICAEHLSTLPEYDNVFTGKSAAQWLITTKTLLVLVDVNNPFIFEAPSLIERIPEVDGVSPIAVIDHHRLTGKLPFNPFLDYIEATKSSASEIIAEMLEQSDYAEALTKEEANLLLAGIMLDTHNFTRAAGAQTFAVAYYLYGRNAHTGTVREFFNERYDELLIASDFDSHTKIYADEFAVTWLSEDHKESPEDRIAASKAADKLLSVRGVEASFALVVLGGSVNVSARSKGKINVQLIMEKLEGGGHFDMAGASVAGTLNDAVERLLSAIDEYRMQYPEQFGNNK